MSRKDFQHLDDEALLDFYHSTRNIKAFRLLYGRYKDCLYRYCAQMNHIHANPILEELWFSVLEHPPVLNGRLFRSWLFIQLDRMLRRHPAFEGEQHTEPEIREKAPAPLLGAIQKLSRRQRNILLLHMECQLPLATVADIECLSLKACRDQYIAGKEQLRELLYGPRRQPWRVEEVTA